MNIWYECARAAPQCWEWGYKTMLRADRASIIFCFYPSLLIFWGTLVANDAKNSQFYLLHIFSGGTGTMRGSPQDTLLCRVEQSWRRAGPKIEWAGAERERSGERGLQKEVWAVSGNFDRSRSALRSHALRVNDPRGGVVRVTWPTLKFRDLLCNFWTGAARHLAFSWVDRPKPISHMSNRWTYLA